ncbi:MAG TPA: AMP-binding protein [Vicinamibacteria bacterium]|nr:AMP-binding protein [Vicinamibacteria bacterium]
MSRPWRRFWPPGVDESRITLPEEPLSVILKRNALATPRRPAIIFYGREVTFAELDDASDRFAGWLRGHGLAPGDRVALYLENSPQFAIAYMGTLKAGCVNVCLNPMNKSAELQRDLSDSGARVLVSSDHGYPAVEAIRGETELAAVAVTSYGDFLPASPTLPVPPSFAAPPERFDRTESFLAVVADSKPLAVPEPRLLTDVALLQYTSGTTGYPKGAEITHGNIVANCELQRVYIDAHPEEDVVLGVLPWFHITGMECQLNLSAYLGTPLVAIGRFDLETVLAAIQRYRCTATTLIATVNVAIASYPGTKNYDLGSMRTCCSGGAPVPEAVAERWEAVTGHKLIEGYGLSETTAPTHINPPHRPKYGTVGLALPFTDVKLVAVEDGVTEVPPGQPGEVVVRGPMVMKGYWKRPEATRETLRDGWLSTGDVGCFDDEGYLRIVERKKDLIKASGFSVYPAEVEAALYRHPSILEAGVVGVPDPYRGEEVVAYVVLRPEAREGLSEQQIVDWSREQMAVYKAPRQVHFLDKLPRTATGKILRRALRERP